MPVENNNKYSKFDKSKSMSYQVSVENGQQNVFSQHSINESFITVFGHLGITMVWINNGTYPRKPPLSYA